MAAPKLTWTSVKAGITDLDRNGLVGLIKDLFDASPENRAFLSARFGPDDAESALSEYRRKIIEQFFPKRGNADPKMSVCRRQISDYRKARGDINGLAELMLVTVESWIEYGRDIYGYDDALCSSVSLIAESLCATLRTDDGMVVYEKLRPRITNAIQNARSVPEGSIVEDSFGPLDAAFTRWKENRPIEAETPKYAPDF